MRRIGASRREPSLVWLRGHDRKEIMKIGIAYSRKRVEEKMISAALEARGIEYGRLDPRKVTFELGKTEPPPFDAVLIRCLSGTNAFYLTRWLESLGIPTVSPHRTVAVCGDKMLTSLALQDCPSRGLPVHSRRMGAWRLSRRWGIRSS